MPRDADTETMTVREAVFAVMRDLGMTTVLVGPHAAASAAPFVHFRTDNLAAFLRTARVQETSA